MSGPVDLSTPWLHKAVGSAPSSHGLYFAPMSPYRYMESWVTAPDPSWWAIFQLWVIFKWLFDNGSSKNHYKFSIKKEHSMSGINKAIIIGRLGSDPELKNLPSGQSVARFNIATSESWTDRNGQKQERTEWHRIVVWNKLAEICGKYLSKGRQVYIEGRLQTNAWEDQQGQKRYTTEVIASTIQFLGSTRDQQPSMDSNQNQTSSPQDFGPEPSFDNTDEIPF